MLMPPAFLILDRKYLSWSNLVQKIQSCVIQLTFITEANSNMFETPFLSTFDSKHQNCLLSLIWGGCSFYIWSNPL